MSQVHRVQTVSECYSLSFDDGPDPNLTPRLLDHLRQFQARATFFVIGEKAIRHPDLIKCIVEQGHEIGNHSYSHPYMLKLSDGELLRQIDRTQYAVFDACGRWPTLFRAPHGRMKKHQRTMLEFNRQIKCCYWSLDPKDWRDQDAAIIASRIVGEVRRGDIVLTHDVLETSVNGVQDALQAIEASDLQSIPISELMQLGEVITEPEEGRSDFEPRSSISAGTSF